jgi:hypothetical protein
MKNSSVLTSTGNVISCQYKHNHLKMVFATQLRIKIVPFGVVLVYRANYATKINYFFFLFIFCVQMYRFNSVLVQEKCDKSMHNF